jgi:prepilin-type N-terminal cleavage/methylation domain-containing protein
MKARRGFTLIEVLSALLILTIVMPTIMAGITVADRAADVARRRSEAAGLAQMELQNVLATESWQNGNASGDFSPDWPDYSWKTQVAAWSGDTEGAGLDEVDMVVSWTERGHPASITLNCLAYPRNTASTSSSSSSTSNTGMGG